MKQFDLILGHAYLAIYFFKRIQFSLCCDIYCTMLKNTRCHIVVILVILLMAKWVATSNLHQLY